MTPDQVRGLTVSDASELWSFLLEREGTAPPQSPTVDDVFGGG